MQKQSNWFSQNLVQMWHMSNRRNH